MNYPKSLSEIADYIKNKSNKTLKEEIDEQLSELFIPAATIIGLLIAPNPMTAIATFKTGVALGTFKFSKLLRWLPDKLNYGKKGREKVSIERYEKAAAINLMILRLAISEGLKTVFIDRITPFVQDLCISEEQKDIILEKYTKTDDFLYKIKLDFLSYHNQSVYNYIELSCKPIFEFANERLISKDEKECDEFRELCEDVRQNIYLYYNSYLVSLVGEFPEFAVWVDISYKQEILAINNKININFKQQEERQENALEELETFNDKLITLINKVDTLKTDTFNIDFGLKNWIDSQKELIGNQTQDIENIFNKSTLDDINAHHKYITRSLHEKLISENSDISHIVYPVNEDIFIPQSFKAITYSKSNHKRRFLEQKFWDNDVQTKEDIKSFLTLELLDPRNIDKGIVILGHPGAGKSMLSKMIAARLTESEYFLPFLVKLRDTTSKTINIGDHINEGLKKAGLSDVKWLEWAKQFKEKICVIILDGFDELLRTSSTELNDYLNAIKRFQDNAINYDLDVRVILTSRLAIMQDVTIPENTTIIKLNSFDENRQKEWIEKWNEFQTKPEFTPFKIPNSASIKELAKEPLLLFMLAVYDFEGNDLQKNANDSNFNQSKLYDKLFIRFTERQVKKDTNFGNLDKKEKERQKELFRLRLGLMSLMMFQKNVTYIDAKESAKELQAFKLNDNNLKPKDILSGFFFVHENKSSEELEEDIYVYEFLHKTFGEFLAADFLLRVVLSQEYRDYKKASYGILPHKETFHFCYGYNWLHRHKKITNFFFEHAKDFFDEKCRSKSKYNDFLDDIEDVIKEELIDVLGANKLPFPIGNITLIDSKPIVEHLAIYSQNLVLLWVALKQDEPFTFSPYNDYNTSLVNNDKEFTDEKQDREETNENKKLWKNLTKLWELSGNSVAVAKLKEWVNVTDNDDEIILKYETGEITHNYLDASIVACNDFERLLIQNDQQLTIENIMSIVERKPEFFDLGIRTINNRFDLLVNNNEKELVNWMEEIDIDFLASISETELIRLIENFGIYFPLHFSIQRKNNRSISRDTIQSVLFSRQNFSKILRFNHGNFMYRLSLPINKGSFINTTEYLLSKAKYHSLFYHLKSLRHYREIHEEFFSKLSEKQIDELNLLSPVLRLNYLTIYVDFIRKRKQTNLSLILHLIKGLEQYICSDNVKDFGIFDIYNYYKLLTLIQVFDENSDVTSILSVFFREVENFIDNDDYISFIYLELYLILIFNNVLHGDKSVLIEICVGCKRVAKHHSIETTAHVIDYFSIICENFDLGNKYDLLEELISYYIKEIRRREYIDFNTIKVYYSLCKIKDNLSDTNILKKITRRIYREIKELTLINRKLSIQFSLIVMQYASEYLHESWIDDYNKYLNNISGNTTNEIDIRTLIPMSDILLSNFTNKFYYETEGDFSDIPQSILNRSILHRQDDREW